MNSESQPARMHGRFLCLLVIALLSACAAPQRPTAPTADVTAARSAESQGEWAHAASLWEAAADADPDSADRYRVNAADAWLKAGERDAAAQALDRVGHLSESTDTGARAALGRAEIALLDGDAQTAEFYLDAVHGRLPSSLRERYRRDRESLDMLMTDPSGLALSDALAVLADSGRQDAAMGLSMLRTLEAVPSDRLALEADSDSPLAPWAAFAIDVRNTLIGRDDLARAAERWQAEHPAHPVDASTYLELAWQYGQYFTPPSRVAVLLPDEGGLARAGAAVRDGIMSAWLDHPGQSRLTIMGLSDDPASVLDAYRSAIRDGYQWVIGPLRREAVELLMAPAAESVPTLALNWPEAESETLLPAVRDDLYGLTLSQTEEARAVADQLLELDLRRVIVMRVDNAWGERAEEAFLDEFLAGGGRVVAIERFNPAEADHSATLTSMLRIEDSRQRRQRLQSALNMPLEFEPTRRTDFDAIFMAAGPELARQLKPQLRFFDAGDVPVFAMSRVYTGETAAGADTDLDGIAFPTTAWAIGRWNDTPMDDLASVRDGTFGALYALGRDAWNVLPWLDMMSRDPAFQFPGEVGRLSVRADGRLARTPVWARFERGRPVPLVEPGPRSASAH